MKSNQTHSLQRLVTELIKKDPDHKRIKELANQSGVEYVEDPIVMMSMVLKSMDKMPAQQLKRKAPETIV